MDIGIELLARNAYLSVRVGNCRIPVAHVLKLSAVTRSTRIANGRRTTVASDDAE